MFRPLSPFFHLSLDCFKEASLFKIINSREVIVFLFIISHFYHLETSKAKEVAVFFNRSWILSRYPNNHRRLDIFWKKRNLFQRGFAETSEPDLIKVF
jgi:hypothetical protein